MTLIYSKETIKHNGRTIFLAGPSQRRDTDISWRPEAIEFFKKNNFKGTLILPEEKPGVSIRPDYNDQIEWEEEGLTLADIILFWIPRDLERAPGFTTNIEWGYWLAEAPWKLVLGSPENAPKMNYLNYYADKYTVPRFDDLEAMIKFICEKKL